MISVYAMRVAVAKLYPGEGWKFRVMNMMKENQVIAIYAKKYGEVDPKRNRIPRKYEVPGQINFDEFLASKNA